MAKTSSSWDRALAPFRSLIIAQGEISYAFNLLQDSFFDIFNLTMALERSSDRPTTFYPFASAIWHVNQNDATQRKLALAGLENLPASIDLKGAISGLQWAIKRAEKLAEYRNLIVHTPLKFGVKWPVTKKLPEIIPLMGSGSTKLTNARKLNAIKNQRFWKSVRNDLLNLNDYVASVGRQIASREYERQNGPVVGALRSWPRKPPLPSIRRIKSMEKSIQDLHAPQKKASASRKRPKRRKSSHVQRPASS